MSTEVSSVDDGMTAYFEARGSEYGRHHEALQTLYKALDIVRDNAKKGNPLRRLGRWALGINQDVYSNPPFAYSLRHPQAEGQKTKIWGTSWMPGVLPDGSQALVRVMAGINVVGNHIDRHVALHSRITPDSPIVCHGVLKDGRYRHTWNLPSASIDGVGQTVERSVNGWNLDWPDYFCDMRNVVRGVRGKTVAPDSPEAVYLMNTVEQVVTSLNEQIPLDPVA